MGLLDDAIRDHLELKRRRGADPAEIERAERDALGPVRRTSESQDQPDLSPVADQYHSVHEGFSESDEWDAAGPELTVEHTHGGDLGWSQEEEVQPASDQQPGFDHDEADEGLAYEQLDDAASEVPPIHEAEPSLDEEPWIDPEEERHAGPGAGDFAGAAGETVQYSLEEGPGPVEPPPNRLESPEEDVLEETPDFLQDTPDHDRLWFEQRPPRDFDFDG
jgi:hypothetical protein